MSLATIRQNREIRKQLEQQLERHRNGLQEKPVADIPPSSLNPHAESGQTESSEDVEKKAGCKGENAQQAQEWQVIQGLEVGGVERRSSAQSLESIESAEPPTTEGKDRAPRPLNADDARSERTRSSSRASRARSIRTLGTRLSVSLTGINVRDRSTKEGGDRDKQVFVVGFEGDDDLMNPHNWSYVKRMKTTCLVAAVGITVGIASSIDAEALMPAAREFHVAEVAESLATGIFLIGFGVGALFAGPFSETFGRVPVYIVTLSLFGIWIMASALAPNFGAQCAFRFLAGACGSTPLTCAGGSIADMYSPKERTLTFPIFANAAFSGPVAAPIM